MMPQQIKEVFQYSTIQKILSLISLTPWETTSFHRTWLPNPCKRLIEVFNYGRLPHAYAGANYYSEKQLL